MPVTPYQRWISTPERDGHKQKYRGYQTACLKQVEEGKVNEAYQQAHAVYVLGSLLFE